MAKKQGSSKTTALFDIRLKNLDHDVLVLKGPAQDAASALLVGKIVLSLNEPIHVKKINLRLYATLHLKWNEPYQTAKGIMQKPVRFSKKIYEHTWDPNELKQSISGITAAHPSSGVESTSSTSPTISRQHSTASLKAFGNSFRSKSSSNLSNLHLTSSSSTNLANLHHSNSQSGSNSHHANSSSASVNGTTGLGQGNHEIPFSAILPGHMPESVEGLPGGAVIYKLEAVIERGKFHAPLVTKRHVRVIRTLTTDAVELSETVAVDNTWPGKVEYSLNVPSKAIAVGTQTPISFTMVPLLKGLRLGDIKIQLVEMYSYLGYMPPPHNAERLLVEKFIPRPHEDDPNFLGMDRWEVDTSVQIPNTLSKCTQDCDVQSHMKVRHKLKFVIGLINPDEHVSELRASLPVQLFISPFVVIKAKYDEEANDSNSDTYSFDENRHKRTNDGEDGQEAEDEEEVLFLSDLHSGSHTSLNRLAQHSNSGSGADLANTQEASVNAYGGFIAPPIYERHVYDVLWSDVSPMESPQTSGSATPRSNFNLSDDVSQQFSMSALDTQKLSENLRQLSLQRQLQESNGSSSSRDLSRNRATFDLDGEAQNDDYFSAVPHAMESPNGILSPPTHLSRVGSENLLPEKMAKVPSYTQALRSDLNEEPLSPMYEPPLPGSNINLAELNKRLELHQSNPQAGHSRNRLLLSRGSSTANLKSMGSSRNSSNSSSPSNSRNQSYSNLSLTPMGTLGNTTASKKSLSGGNSSTNIAASMPQPTPMPKPSEAAHPPEVLKLSSSASDRSALLNRTLLTPAPVKSTSSLNLQNLPFLHKKKN